jgi:protein SCO1/2
MTAPANRPLPRSVWLGCSLAFSLVGLAVFVSILQNARQQKIPLPVIGQIAGFTLTNQDGEISTLADFTNRVWIADIIFTSCGGPCPRMTAQMKSIQDRLPKESSTKLATLTTYPEFDTPELLKKYGTHFGADFNRWTFLTGEKMQIGQLSANSLKLASQPVKPEDQKSAADLFIHSTYFVAVDKHAQLRAVFETGGDGVDWTNGVMPKILATVKQLENEP